MWLKMIDKKGKHCACPLSLYIIDLLLNISSILLYYKHRIKEVRYSPWSQVAIEKIKIKYKRCHTLNVHKCHVSKDEA